MLDAPDANSTEFAAFTSTPVIDLQAAFARSFDQGDFLKALGLEQRAQALSSRAAAASYAAASAQLARGSSSRLGSPSTASGTTKPKLGSVRIGASPVLRNPFQVAGQQPDRLIDLGTHVLAECGDRWSRSLL